jgi:hypothetical protein
MKHLVLASFVGFSTLFGFAAIASAAPASTALSGLSSNHSGIVQHVADRRDRRHWRQRDHGGKWRSHRGYRQDRYRGWHRYHSRPSNWRTRGCVALGPVWVCP